MSAWRIARTAKPDSARRSSTRSVNEGSVDGGSGRRRGLEWYSSVPISLFLNCGGCSCGCEQMPGPSRSRQVARVVPLKRRGRLCLLHHLEHRFERSGGMQLLHRGRKQRSSLRGATSLPHRSFFHVLTMIKLYIINRYSSCPHPEHSLPGDASWAASSCGYPSSTHTV